MNDEIDTGEFVYHYNREKRLENAPEIVKQSYSGELPTPPNGIFEALVHTKASKILLFTLLFVLVITVGIILFGRADANSLNKIDYSISAFSFEDKVYVSINANPQSSSKNMDQKENNHSLSENSYSNNEINIKDPIIFTIIAYDNDKQVINKKELQRDSIINQEFIRTIFTDYDIISIEVLVSYKQEKISMNCSVKKN